MKQKYKWLLDIAEKKPLLFIVLLLLIAVSTLATVVAVIDKRGSGCEEEKKLIQQRYENKFDTLNAQYNRKLEIYNEEVKLTLNGIIDDYKSQLDEQKKLNQKITKTINENKKIINKRKT